MFFKGSRYATVDVAEFEDERGRVLRYKKLRLIPVTRVLRRHEVRSGDRLDLIAQRYFKDPERFWRICDANFTLWPEDLTADPGEIIDIPPAKG